jgi:hypothetical protein
MTFVPSSLRLAAVFIAALAAQPAVAADDPLAPRSSAANAVVSPLAAVTIGSADLGATARFYEQAMAMRCARMTFTRGQARRFRAHYGMARGAAVEALTCDRPGLAGVGVRAVLLSPDTGSARPAYDARLTGALSLGFPSRDNVALDARARQLGFTSTAGLTSITMPAGDGGTYNVGEVHFRAPDDVYALGIDRGRMPAVGLIDPEAGVGGPAYAGMMVGSAASAATFFGTVLGLEKRREVRLTSSGPTGGLGLPAATRFDFQQWYAPGATSGYIILMELLDNQLPPVRALGLQSRGIGLWTFSVLDLAETRRRAMLAGFSVGRSIMRSPWPTHAGRRSLILRTADGFPIEVVEGLPTVAASPRARVGTAEDMRP